MSTNQNTLGKMSNYRWTICAMLFFATTVNYLDRQVLLPGKILSPRNSIGQMPIMEISQPYFP